MSADDLELRSARADDPDERAAIIALLAASLGRDEDPRFAELYAWKHEQNAFGPSPAWVAVDGGRIVEQGSHADLVERNGLYAELTRTQLGHAVT